MQLVAETCQFRIGWSLLPNSFYCLCSPALGTHFDYNSYSFVLQLLFVLLSLPFDGGGERLFILSLWLFNL